MAEHKNQFKQNPGKTDTKKSSKSKKPKKAFSKKNITGYFKDDRFKKIMGLFFIIFSAYLLIAFVSYLFSWKADDNIFENAFFDVLFNKQLIVENWSGRLGALVGHTFIKEWFGIASFLFIPLFFVTGVRMFLNIKIIPLKKLYKYSFFGLIWSSVTFGYLFTSEDLRILGGIFGYHSNLWLTGILGNVGTGLLVLFALLSFSIVVFNFPNNLIKSWLATKNKEAEYIEEDEKKHGDFAFQKENPGNDDTQKDNENKEKEKGGDELELILEEQLNTQENEEKERTKPGNEEGNIELEYDLPKQEEETIDQERAAKENFDKAFQNANEVKDKDPSSVENMKPYDPREDLSSYQMPSFELLEEHGSNKINVRKEELEANKNKIVETLNNYSIKIDKIKATIGPTVTLYEIIPAPGIRISKIKNLEDDIALSLAALGIRIIAPIPGRGTIGIEVPNSKPEIVSMKSILNSDSFRNTKFELPIALGKNISNEDFIADLTKMPHLLIAGATGQGKSVGLNAILASILHKKHPSEVKFVLVDPKKVELNLFSKIERHFLAKLPELEEPIITDTRLVVKTLNSLCVEMDQRYELLKDAQVRNIKEYNAKFKVRRLNPGKGHRFLPYVILIVDEFADLIMTAGKEVELPIARLAQLARAVGIHLIIATQRPSVNIITGTIKANFPARIAFRVTSKVDSRTILDTGGAEQLIGRGDMLLSTGTNLLRLQCAFIDTPEVEKITDFIGSQRGYTDAFLLPEYQDDEADAGGLADDEDRDEMFEDAARLIVAHQQGSTSLLQRKLKLGYNRAGRIIDQLEAAGIVGPFEGSKAREVKIQDEMALEQFLKKDQ